MRHYLRLPDGTVGDPQLFYRNGVYHLFYMFCHEGTSNGSPMAHAVSEDLIHWETLPDAILPGPYGSPDYAGIASGSIIERDGVFHFFYTGRNSNRDGKLCYTICRATSRDLVQWTKDSANPILERDERWYSTILGNDWRDPCVFFNPHDRRYWMLITTMAKEPEWSPRRGCLGLAVSADLDRWEIRPPLWTGHDEKALECMHPVMLNSKTFLVYSCDGVEYKTLEGTDFNGPWITDPDHRLDGGDFYAPSLFYLTDMDGYSTRRHIAVGWIKGQAPWGGAMSLPRDLTVGPDGKLAMTIAKEIVKEFDHSVFDSSVPIAISLGEFDRQDRTIVLNRTDGMAAALFADFGPNGMLEVEIVPETDNVVAGLFLRCQNGLNGPGYTLAVESHPPRLAFRRWDPWADKSPLHEVPLIVQPGRKTTLRVFLTRTVMEAFVNDRRGLSARLNESEWGHLGLFVKWGKARFENLRFSTASTVQCEKSRPCSDP